MGMTVAYAEVKIVYQNPTQSCFGRPPMADAQRIQGRSQGSHRLLTRYRSQMLQANCYISGASHRVGSACTFVSLAHIWSSRKPLTAPISRRSCLNMSVSRQTFRRVSSPLATRMQGGQVCLQSQIVERRKGSTTRMSGSAARVLDTRLLGK
jgi:hypothetical protein